MPVQRKQKRRRDAEDRAPSAADLIYRHEDGIREEPSRTIPTLPTGRNIFTEDENLSFAPRLIKRHEAPLRSCTLVSPDSL